LIVINPKSLLRHKLAVSSLEELADGTFLPVIPEIDDLSADKVKRIILCSGKIYYELLEKRRAEKREEVVIFRIEQLYPFPEIELQTLLKQYDKAKEVIWCQEEPQNQGAWYSTSHHLQTCLLPGQQLRYAGRAPSAAPAVGYFHLHQEQQIALVNDAFG
jgi:2-oxoglutarate dehydrogenase E1 component